MGQLSPEIQAILDATRVGIKEAEARVDQLRQIEAMLLGNGSAAGQPRTIRQPRQPADTMTLGEAVEKVLAESGEPMNTDVIAQTVLDKKLYPPKTDDFRNFSNTVFSTLRRKDDVFMKVSPGVWGLLKWKKG
jgi:hypothetical protein